jgi:hypothetical protein
MRTNLSCLLLVPPELAHLLSPLDAKQPSNACRVLGYDLPFCGLAESTEKSQTRPSKPIRNPVRFRVSAGKLR